MITGESTNKKHRKVDGGGKKSKMIFLSYEKSACKNINNTALHLTH